MKQCIVFPISMKNVGILYHFTELSIALYQGLKDDPNVDLFLISEHGEQNPGLWDKLREFVPDDCISKHQSSTEFSSFVENKIISGQYETVVYLSQGIVQFLDAIKLKKKYKDKLWLYTRLNSFKHGTFYRGPLTFFLSLIFKRYADFVNFQCEGTVRIFKNSMSLFRAGKAGIIPLGLSVEEDLVPSDTELTGLFENPSAKNIVYLANFHKHKRQRDLILYMKEFLLKNTNLNLILLGEGLCLEDCKSLAVKYGLEGQVHFPGRLHRKYVPYILRRSDLSIVFSEVETFGHNILEPLFYGSPVISSNVGIASDVIKDFSNGALLCSTSQNEFRIKAGPYLGLGQSGDRSSIKEIARATYSWEVVVRQYKAMFSQVRQT